MPTKYTHLSTEERVAIMVMQLQQLTLRTIAVLLRRHPSTISREIRQHSLTLGWKFPVEVLVDYLQLSASNKLETIN
jgi:Transposase and inactivated derivatives, IS30 family